MSFFSVHSSEMGIALFAVVMLLGFSVAILALMGMHKVACQINALKKGRGWVCLSLLLMGAVLVLSPLYLAASSDLLRGICFSLGLCCLMTLMVSAKLEYAH